jgi:hypothetical protein
MSTAKNKGTIPVYCKGWIYHNVLKQFWSSSVIAQIYPQSVSTAAQLVSNVPSNCRFLDEAQRQNDANWPQKLKVTLSRVQFPSRNLCRKLRAIALHRGACIKMPRDQRTLAYGHLKLLHLRSHQ